MIGAGFGRTGTKSLQAALEELGFGPCYHMTELFEHPEHVRFWEAARRGEPVGWDDFLGEYEAAVDWPAGAFYEELMEKYPDAKVLLSVRDPERWYESTRSTIYRMRGLASSPFAPAIVSAAGVFSPTAKHAAHVVRAMRRASRVIDGVIWEGTFGGRFEDRQHAIGVFERHVEEVKRRVPAEKLLVYEVKDGWGPLCAFLGVEVPKRKPFPRSNDMADFRRTFGRRSVPASAAFVGVGVSLGVLALLCLTWLAAEGGPKRRLKSRTNVQASWTGPWR